MTAKKILATVLSAALLAFTLCMACGCQPSNEDVIRDTVTKNFDAYKNLEDSVLSEIAAKAEEDGMSDLGITGEEYATAVLDGFDYHINDITVNEQAATVSMTIVSKSKTDFYNKLNDAVSAFVADPATESLSPEERDAQVGQIAMQAFRDTDTVSEDVNLRFQLQGNTWVSVNSTEVLGNLDSFAFPGNAA